MLKAIYSGKYIRKVEEPDKEAILAAATNKKVKLLSDADLAECGLRINKGEEEFYAKLDWKKLEEVE